MNDDITTLRLELCRERDRANALEAALTKAVQELIAKVLQSNLRKSAEINPSQSPQCPSPQSE